ncbi:RagB/SusD family nutrient uptake outer membrane protein [Fulvivirgaceae bacterium PWU4]|uniref:RagB/SusD family nutrient uptake outer membrane protein n=1 Tax=Chryseosolibacter histidini TaxID=2782349 RepID=A0AAP2DI97_9BACT|nr:RagB/SusD family nutrient uptake outer membrane protein [Chryseosolibacter histidini]MBT1695517.1 RagB/SusD family nutrient uptake outer membrane protein [Chryseosolibacter histidini]
MKLKKIITTISLTLALSACTDLDIAPKNVTGEDDIFGSNDGVMSNVARIYSRLPIEDFKYYYPQGFNVNGALYKQMACLTGEAVGRDTQGADNEGQLTNWYYWDEGYAEIRDINTLLEKIPQYASKLGATETKTYLAEARFNRAFTYFALAKRYGGVPLVSTTIDYPASVNIEGTRLFRASEEAIWDFIAADLDYAIENLPENSPLRGRVNKYVAAAFKSRAMLYAGSIAKYNTIEQTQDQNGTVVRTVGIPANRANDYFKAAYDAAKLVVQSNKYALYKGLWKAGDKAAQATNFRRLFLTETTENIFVKYYDATNAAHNYDESVQPYQTKSGGNDSEVSPTMDFIEMFDGIAKDPDGHFDNIDDNGFYNAVNSPLDAFANAEPRLRATVIFPMDVYRGQVIEIRRGIWTGNTVGGKIPKLASEGAIGNVGNIPQSNLSLAPSLSNNTAIPLEPGDPRGATMKPAGANGPVNAWDFGNTGGTYLAKYLAESGTTTGSNSTQSWIEIRYAEVLLNQAEAAYELYQAGQSGDSYLTVAFNNINSIRERAGANLLAGEGDLNNINIVRIERRKELAFENKTYWDLKRWRVLHEEQNNRRWRILNTFYSTKAQQYFLSVKFQEPRDVFQYLFTFDTKYYYQPIPPGEINKNPNCKQNPGF